MGWFTKFDVFDFFFPDVALIALEIEVDGAFERVVVDGVCKDADNLHGEFGSLVTDGVEDAEVGNFHRVCVFVPLSTACVRANRSANIIFFIIV